MDFKKICIGVLIVFIVIIIFASLIPSQDFVEVKGSPKVSASNLTLFYNNDVSDYVAVSEHSQTSLYYDNKTLQGVIALDLSNVTWDKNYKPWKGNGNSPHVNNISYAQNHFSDDVKDCKFNFVDLSFYSSNGSKINLVDNSIDAPTESIVKNVTFEGNILKLYIYKNFNNDNQVEEISNSANYQGSLSASSGGIDEISYVNVLFDFYNDDATYGMDVNLTGNEFKLTHL